MWWRHTRTRTLPMPRGDVDDYIRVSSRSRLLDDGWDETLRALESARYASGGVPSRQPPPTPAKRLPLAAC